MKLAKLLAATAAIAIATPAQAVTLLYQFQGHSFTIDEQPVPIENGIGGFKAALTGPPYSGVYFWTSLFGGGFSLYNMSGNSILDPYGPQLFNGDVANPTLYSGTFYLQGIPLYVTQVVAPVPEPLTWAMMIGGFGLIGGLMRRRAQVRTTVSFG